MEQPKKRGPKPKDPTTVLTFRVPADKAKELKPIIEACIKNYLNPETTPVPKITKPESTKPINKSTSKEPSMGDLWESAQLPKTTLKIYPFFLWSIRGNFTIE